jgi:hypothetical protein
VITFMPGGVCGVLGLGWARRSMFIWCSLMVLKLQGDDVMGLFVVGKCMLSSTTCCYLSNMMRM